MKKNEVFALLIEAFQQVVGTGPDHVFLETDSMDALGANSMDRAEIIMMVLDRMNLDIPLVETLGPSNLGELAGLLSEKSR